MVPNTAIEWATLPGVRSFQIFWGVDEHRERIELQFGFDGHDAWDAFVQRSMHRNAMATLESVCSDVGVALWTPGAVSQSDDEEAKHLPIGRADSTPPPASATGSPRSP